ncbi:integrase, catalytic region, zinc finger, CCHC-type containing protein [Tanacetum coccineum]
MDPMISLGQKNTLAEYMILSGADNRPPMLDKDLYDSWKSRMELYMQNREHGRMILESVEHGPLIWPTVEENGVIRTKKYAELSAAEKIQADCDMKATNIILQGLPADIYSLVNHHRVAKDLWERVQLLMQGTSLTKQEREFNTKFLNSLPPKWSKFVTDVKLVKDLHTSNFDQLHAYLQQHELYANEVRIMREINQDPLAFVANQQMTPPHFNIYQSYYNNPQLQQQFSPSQHGTIQPNQHYSSHYPSQTQFNHSSIPPSHTFQSQMNHQTSTVPQVIPQVAYQSPQAPTQLMTESPFRDSGFAVPIFSPRDDPIACLNKAMAFLTAVASSRFPSTNNQLRTSSNLRNQATIQDGRVTVQQVQGRQGQNYSGTGYKGNANSSGGNNASGQARVVKCYNCQAGQILDEEQNAFLADPGILDGQVVQTIIPNNVAFQTEDLDTYDSDCDDVSNAKAVLMANISNYGFDIISEVAQIVLWYLDSGCSKHMTGNHSQLMNFVSKFLGTVRFGNDQISRIMRYGDYQLGNVAISRVYYVDGLGHNLFSVRQFCDADLEVAFWKNTCFIRNLEGVDLLSGSRDTNLYTISLDDMLKTSSICLLSTASKNKRWLWHRRLSHLNFCTLNKLAKDSLARGIPKLKFQKDHLCSAYNGTEFVNQTLSEFYENVGISHQTSVARTPQ